MRKKWRAWMGSQETEEQMQVTFSQLSLERPKT